MDCKLIKKLMPTQILLGLDIVMWVGALGSFYVEKSDAAIAGFLWAGLVLSLLHEFIKSRSQTKGESNVSTP